MKSIEANKTVFKLKTDLNTLTLNWSLQFCIQDYVLDSQAGI